MGNVLAVLSGALHATFALLGRKLILCSEIIAIIGMVGWRLDARIGIPVWSRQAAQTRRLGDLLAGGATLAVVLYVAFVRDYADLGQQHELWRYSARCLAIIAAITFVGVVSRFRGPVDSVGSWRSWAFHLLPEFITQDAYRKEDHACARVQPASRLAARPSRDMPCCGFSKVRPFRHILVRTATKTSASLENPQQGDRPESPPRSGLHADLRPPREPDRAEHCPELNVTTSP